MMKCKLCSTPNATMHRATVTFKENPTGVCDEETTINYSIVLCQECIDAIKCVQSKQRFKTFIRTSGGYVS